ncbi:hypothetical protein [Paenibacillus pinihumi]|uniref:hypothetical protein n=1 Tax=Paenibacillus pinihumi TaxID=669462 RepID=UPI000561C389|nr:hypothetical protein [Paenibacillus pinihumi]
MGLNYIWDLVIRAEQQGLAREKLHFRPGRVFSPYMELSPVDLNARMVEQAVDVNPYYRFYELFKDMFDVNVEDAPELRDALFDIIVHFLAELDLKQGMNKREYYIRFVLADMEAGRFGEGVSRALCLFSREERDRIAGNVLRLYETGEALYLLRDTLRYVFPRSTLYAHCEERDELLLYIGQENNEITQAKAGLIMDLFLPERFQTELYWEAHFGIVDVEETMRLDCIAMY